MNKTKIEWTDYTWNPITGCLNGCDYCYARKIYQRFKRSFLPAIHGDRLYEPSKIKKPSMIFTGSVTDIWGSGVKPQWRNNLYDVMRINRKHTFQVLTKQPQNIEDDVDFPENLWIGVSVTDGQDQWRIDALQEKKNSGGWFNKTFVSYEPMMGYLKLFGEETPVVDWIILGAMTGRGSKKHTPSKGMISDAIDWGRMMGNPIFMKNSLRPYWEGKLIQQFPKETP